MFAFLRSFKIKKFSSVLFVLFFALSAGVSAVHAQNRFAALTASPRVNAVLREAGINQRRDFLYGIYARDFNFSAPNGLPLPRSGTSLSASGNYFYRAVFDSPENSGRNPQFDLPVILRAILGDSTAVIGAWAYSDLVNIAQHPDAAFNGCCRNNIANSNPARTYQQDELESDGNINVENLRRALRSDQSRAGGPLSVVEAHQLAQIVISAALMGQRARGEEFIADRHFRYQSSEYRDWSKLDIFVGLHPEMVSGYGNYFVVISDRRGRSIDLNAYNHNYYARPEARVCAAHNGVRTCQHGGENYYSEINSDNAEFIIPGEVRYDEIEGLDIHNTTMVGATRTTLRPVEVAYRRISLGGSRSAVLVIDPREANGIRHTCVRLETLRQIPYACSREDVRQPQEIRDEQPLQLPFARVPQRIGAPLSVVGAYITCPENAAVGSAQCRLPANIVSRYRQSTWDSLAAVRHREEQTRRADIEAIRVNGQTIRFIPLTTGTPASPAASAVASTDSSGTSSSN